MSNSVATVTQFRQQLTNMSGEFTNALPSHIKPEKFQRTVMTAVQQNPGLLNADRKTLLASCLKCAADGLIPDGREAALVMFGNVVNYMPMFTGIQKRVRNSGVVSKIESHVIYENDFFEWEQGISSNLKHKPLFPGDRGKPVGAYAIAKFNDGSDPQFEVMDVSQIERVRSVSRSKSSGPWVQWWDEQARKTVFKRLAKWLPLDADVDDLIEYDNSVEREDPEPVVVKATPKRGSKLDAIVAEEPKEPEVIDASPEPETINTTDELVSETDDF